MAHRRASPPANPTIREHQVPVGVAAKKGRSPSSCHAAEAEPEAALSAGAKAALGAIGGWRGLDWDETIENLERIRRESKPSPPLDDL